MCSEIAAVPECAWHAMVELKVCGFIVSSNPLPWKACGTVQMVSLMLLPKPMAVGVPIPGPGMPRLGGHLEHMTR